MVKRALANLALAQLDFAAAEPRGAAVVIKEIAPGQRMTLCAVSSQKVPSGTGGLELGLEFAGGHGTMDWEFPDSCRVIARHGSRKETTLGFIGLRSASRTQASASDLFRDRKHLAACLAPLRSPFSALIFQPPNHVSKNCICRSRSHGRKHGPPS